MPWKPTVPESLGTGPFTVAQALDSGLTRRMLDSKHWRRVLTGVYVADATRDSPALRLEALALVLRPGYAASGLTAAWAHGLWTPPSWRPAPLVQARPLGGAQIRRRGTLGRRQVLDDDLVEVQGICVTSALRTCFDLMRCVPVVEAVTVADAFVSADLPADELWTYVDRHRRWPGVDQARLAVRLCSDQVRSSGESRLRMVVVLSGMPEPLVNPPLVLESPLGPVTRYPDLLMLTRRMTVLEYDGAYHDDEGQAEKDGERENLLVASADLPVLRYRKKQLRQVQIVADEVAAVCRLRPLRPLDPRDFWLPRHRSPW